MFFHHHTVRKYTISLLDVFNDIEVPRYDEEGVLLKVINTPIVFSSTRDRAIQLIEQDYSVTDGQQVLLPRMALSLVSMEKSTSRDTNRYNKVNLNKSDNSSVSYQYNSVAYDFYYTLNIMARTMTDLMVIVEQILPMFRPTMNMRFRELEFVDEDTSVPVNLGAVTFDFPDSMDEDDNIKILNASIDLSIRGALHLPIKGGLFSIFGLWSLLNDLVHDSGLLPIFNRREDGTSVTSDAFFFKFKAGVLYKIELEFYGKVNPLDLDRVCELRSKDETFKKPIDYNCDAEGNCKANVNEYLKFDNDTLVGIYCSGATILKDSFIRITEGATEGIIKDVIVNTGTEIDHMNGSTVRAIFDESKPFGDINSSITTIVPK